VLCTQKPPAPQDGTADLIASGSVTPGQKTGFGPRIRGIWPMHSLTAASLTAVHFLTMPQKPALLICISRHLADAAATFPSSRYRSMPIGLARTAFAIICHMHT
jgi:hypothetical protein